MTRITQLKREARESCEWRGHDMGRFYAEGKHFTAICRRCSKWVCVTPNPLPNEIDIGGPAVAVGCED